MNKIKTYSKLSSVLKLVVDNRGKTVPTSESGFPLIATNCIKHASIFPVFEHIRYVNEEVLNTWFRAHLEPNDILFVNKGTPGRCCLVPNPVSFCVAQDMIALRSNEDEIDYRYLFMVLRSEFIQRKIENFHVGLVIPHFKKGDIDNILIPRLENKEMEAKAGKMYIDLSSKIELNNKINAELEAMAKTLYDYWFVQFDFPNEDGKPYKSSDGKMVWNEDLKREVPEGWEVKELGDVISRSGTGLNPRDNFQLGFGKNYYITIKNVKGGKIIFDDSCDRVDDAALKIIDKRSDLQIGDTLFTSIEPVGVTYLLHEKPQNWNINESVFTLRPDYSQITSEYLYMLLSSIEMKAYTKNASAGSIHKGIRHSVLKMFKLPYGNKDIIDNFSGIIAPILKRINVIDQENQKLAELRDFLLPMLMNGQVVVE